MVVHPTSIALLVYQTVVYTRCISLLVYPTVVYSNSDIGLAYPTVVYTRSISLLASGGTIRRKLDFQTRVRILASTSIPIGNVGDEKKKKPRKMF